MSGSTPTWLYRMEPDGPWHELPSARFMASEFVTEGECARAGDIPLRSEVFQFRSPCGHVVELEHRVFGTADEEVTDGQ